MGNQYWLEGTVSVPKERKAELSESILMLLERCGIRKLREIAVDGKMVTVARRPKADSRGIVEFDYSAFEGQRREGFCYNKNECTLCVGDCGYAEFGGDSVGTAGYLESPLCGRGICHGFFGALQGYTASEGVAGASGHNGRNFEIFSGTDGSTGKRVGD